MEDEKKNISARIRLVMAHFDMNIKMFATKVEMPYRTMQQYLSGDRYPRSDGLIRLSRHSGVSLDWLLLGEGPMLRVRSTNKNTQTSPGTVGVVPPTVKTDNNEVYGIPAATRAVKLMRKADQFPEDEAALMVRLGEFLLLAQRGTQVRLCQILEILGQKYPDPINIGELSDLGIENVVVGLEPDLLILKKLGLIERDGQFVKGIGQSAQITAQGLGDSAQLVSGAIDQLLTRIAPAAESRKGYLISGQVRVSKQKGLALVEEIRGTVQNLWLNAAEADGAECETVAIVLGISADEDGV